MSKSFDLFLAFVVLPLLVRLLVRLLVPLLARMRALALPLPLALVLAAIRLPGARGSGAKRHHMPFLVLPLA